MTAALLYTFAVAPELAAADGAAPSQVLARQLPRMAVQALNGAGDRGVRYLPLVGVQDGERRFLQLDAMLDAEMALRLHRLQVRPRVVVDGCLGERALRLRMLEGDGGRVAFEQDVPFDPRAPLAAVARLLFELMGQLGWPGGPPSLPALEGDALAHYLQGRDDLLRLEARMVVHEPARSLAAAARSLALAPLEGAVHRLLLELGGRVVALGSGAPPDIAMVFERCAAGVVDAACVAAEPASQAAADFVEEVAGMLAGAGAGEPATAVAAQLARLRPGHPEAACRVAGAAYAQGRLEHARAVLQRARSAGPPHVTVLAQLAVVEQELGATDQRRALVDELLACPGLTPPVARVAACYLLEDARQDAARALLERVLEQHDDDAGLWLDYGRALLLLRDETAAVAALRRCLALEPDAALRREAERHLGLARVPSGLTTAQRIDAALRAGDTRSALAEARALVRRAAQLPDGWLLLGMVRQRLEQPRRAERALRRALRLSPELGEAHNRLGILLVGRRRYAEGHRHLCDAVRLLPEEPAPRIHLAQACHYLGWPDASRAALAEAERLGAHADTLAAVRRAFFEES